MSDRLAQLRRQRALAQEQLDWINREIAAAESASPPVPAAAQEQTQTAPAAKSLDADLATGGASATEEEIIARYRLEPDRLKHDVKRGCLLYFAAALALLAAGVAILYFTFTLRPR